MADVIIKTQKLIKVGNSYAVTVDKRLIDKHNVKSDDKFIIEVDIDTGTMSVSTPKGFAAKKQGKLSLAEKQAVLSTKITPELQSWTKKFIEENKEAMDKLANL